MDLDSSPTDSVGLELVLQICFGGHEDVLGCLDLLGLWELFHILFLDLLGLWELFHLLSLDLHGLKNLLQNGRQQLEARPCCLEGLSDPCCVKVWQKEKSRGGTGLTRLSG